MPYRVEHRDWPAPDHARAGPDFHLPSTIELLVAGGDERIALDATSRVNRYGCGPSPQDGIAAFGSSTASTISIAAYNAADRLRARLLETVANDGPAVVYARENQRTRSELLDLCGLSGRDRPDAVIGASGTDLHLVAAQLAGHADPSPLLAIMVEANETGSGVAAALAGRHFGTHAMPGACASGSAAIEVATVAVRDAAGMPRPSAAVDGEVERLVRQASLTGRRVLLVVADTTKTGLIAPSIGCAARLRRQNGTRVDILVDACQFRIAASTLRAYLRHDFMVVLTGSKFVTGPAFSGVLLIPAAVARRLRQARLAAPIDACSRHADWPAGWPQANGLDATSNFGLLLRWEAALAELRAFRTIPEANVTAFLQAFAHAIQTRLAHDPRFEPLPVPPLERGPLAASPGWDRIPTIFPFVLRHIGRPSAAHYFSRAETRQVYGWLQAGGRSNVDRMMFEAGAKQPCQVGQPVACGMRSGVALSALRLCVSARLIVEGAAGSGRHADQVIARALRVLERIARLADTHWPAASDHVAALS